MDIDEWDNLISNPIPSSVSPPFVDVGSFFHFCNRPLKMENNPTSGSAPVFQKPAPKSRPPVPLFTAPTPSNARQPVSQPVIEKDLADISAPPAAIPSTPKMVTPPPHSYKPPSWGAIPCASIHLEVIRQGVEIEPIFLCGPIEKMYSGMVSLARRVKKYGAEEEYTQGSVNVLYSALNRAEAARAAAASTTEGTANASSPAPSAVTECLTLDEEGVEYETLSGLSYITVGRVPVAHIQVEHQSLSRIHCILQFNAKGEVFLQDISTHGVRVNKNPIPKNEPYQLYDGDTFILGESSRMFVLCHSNGISRATALGAEQYVPSAQRERAMEVKMQKARNIAAASSRVRADALEKAQADAPIVIRDAEEEETVFRAWLEWEEEEGLLASTSMFTTDVGSSKPATSSMKTMLSKIGKTDKQRALIDKYRDAQRRMAALEERVEEAKEGGRGGKAVATEKLQMQLEKAMETVEDAEEALLASFRAKLGYGSEDKKRAHVDSDDEDVYDKTKRSR